MDDHEEDAIVAAIVGTERLAGDVPQDEAEWMELMLRKLAIPPLTD